VSRFDDTLWPIMRSSLVALALLLIAGTGAAGTSPAARRRRAPRIDGTEPRRPLRRIPVNPVPPPNPADPPLPALADSDPLVQRARRAAGADATATAAQENLIRRAVATVDNLTRRKLSIEQRPWRRPGISGNR
jgi:hypothetical protein